MKTTLKRVWAEAAALVLAGQLCLPAAALERSGAEQPAGDLTISETFSDAKLIAWLTDARNLNGAGADGVLTLAERQAVTALDLSGQGLTSLEGLAAFLDLETLDCSQNKLTQLDLSGNPKLTRLYCSYNQLTRLDVSGHGELIALNCEMNKLEELNLSGCTGLLSLYCRNNLLTQPHRRHRHCHPVRRVAPAPQ